MVANSWDPVKNPFFRMYVFSDDTKTQMVTRRNIGGTVYDAPITRIISMKRTQVLMQPDQHSITFAITDPRTGVFAPQGNVGIGVPGFNKGSYYEIFAGKDYPAANSVGGFSYAADAAYRRPWANGYVQDVIRTATKGAQFEITGVSSMIWLSNFVSLNTLEMDFKTDNPTKKEFNSSYLNVMYALNGLNGSGGYGGPEVAQGPFMKGILTGTGWKAKWVDGSKPEPGFKQIPGYGDSWYTAWETVLMNLQTIAQHYNLFFREGDISGASSTGHHGTLEFGPLNDPSNVTVWGGKELDTLLNQTAQNSPLVGGGFIPKTEGNAMDAAEYTTPLSVIQAVQFEDKMDHIINLCWPLGHGSSESDMVTLLHFFHPIEDKNKKINATYTINGPLKYSWIDLVNYNLDQTKISADGKLGTVNGAEVGLHDYFWRWQPSPGSRIYYLMKTYTIGGKKYNGMVAGWDTDPNKGPIVLYQLVASQNQDGTWAYGIMELNSAMKYGIHEYVLTHDKKVTDPRLLLSAAIGAVENSAEAIPSWMIPVKHPVDPLTGLPSPSGSGKTPSFAKVGQMLDVRFTGYVYESIEQNQDGQWYGEGKSYDYMHFPTKNAYSNYENGVLVNYPNGDINNTVNGLLMDQHMFDKILRIVQIEEQWTGHVYDVTYTMGKGKWRKQHWADTIAQRFQNQLNIPPRPYAARHMKRERYDNIRWIFEFKAHLDLKQNAIILPTSGSLDPANPSNPGSIVVSDIDHDHFFDDTHKIQYTVLSEDPSAVVDFWFHKPLSHHLVDINVDPNDAYGLFRMGFSDVDVGGNPIKGATSSGKMPGFYVCKTDANLNVRNELKVGLNYGGHNTKYPKLAINTEYHVTLQWHNGIHKAWVTNKSKRGDKHELVAEWRDMGGKNNDPLLLDYDYTKNPPVPLIDKKTGQKKSQFGAIGWHCFGGNGNTVAKVYDLHITPLKNSLGIHSVGEVQANGSQATIVNTHAPVGSGTGLVEAGAANDNNPNSFVTAQTQVHQAGKSFALGQLLTGTYPAKMQLTADLTPANRTVLFDSNIGGAAPNNDPKNNSVKFNGLPLAAMPHNVAQGFTATLVSSQTDSLGSVVTETITVSPDSGLTLVPTTNPYFDSNDPWYRGFILPATYVLENTYPKDSIIYWHHTPHGGKIFEKYYKGTQKFTDIGSGKPFYDHGWAKILEIENGKQLVLFPDGHIGWDNEHKTDTAHFGGGMKAIAPLVNDGEHMAAGLDGHGVQIFDSLERDSATQKIYLYTEAGALATTTSPSIDNSNPRLIYSEGDNLVSSVIINNPGTGYTNATPITFSDPVHGTTATASLVVDNTGKITNVVMGSKGSGYDVAPTINLGTPGSGADLQPKLGGVPLGSPYNPSDSESIQASWVYNDQNDNTAGDSDNILQLTTGGGTSIPNGSVTPTPLNGVPTTVLWQDTQLLLDIDSTGNRKRKQFNIKKDISFHFPIYIEPSSFTGVKTLGAECTLASNVPSGSTSLPVMEPVGDLVYASGDTWSLNPSKAEMDNSDSDHEIFTFQGVDASTNSILISPATTFNHYQKEPILQNTYQGQNVHSGGKMTSNQYMDDMLPGADAIAFGLLAEYQETSNSTITVTTPGTMQAATFTSPITDFALNTVSPVTIMINYRYSGAGGLPDFEVFEPGSYTLQTDTQGHVTGFTAPFQKSHSSGFTVTYSRWHRGWFGNPSWIAPYKNDVRPNIIKDALNNTVYEVQVGSTRTMKHLGTLGGPNNVRAGEWIDLHAKASQFGLYRVNGKTRRSTIVGCEIAIHTPPNVTPFTVLFDAHSAGATSKSPPKGASGMKKGAVTFHHKNPKGFGDSTFAADLFLWAQQDGVTDNTSPNYKPGMRNDGNYYVHWEHDTGDGTTPGTIITHAKPKENNRHQIWAGPRQDFTSGGVSEDHPNWGIPAWPLIKDNAGNIITATLKDGTAFPGTDINHIAWHHVFFNTNSSGFMVHDPGVLGNKVWVPGYNKVGSQATASTTGGGNIIYTIPSSEIKQWQNYVAMSTINSGSITYNGAYVLVTKGNSNTALDPTPMLVLNVNASNNTLVLGPTGGPVPTPAAPTQGNYILGQTMGLAIVTHHFEWGNPKSGGAILHGPHEDFFRIGQIQNKADPATGEIYIKCVGENAKTGGGTTRAGSAKPGAQHYSNPSAHAHHNLAFYLNSKGKTPNTGTQSTFHAHKIHPNNTQAQIETHKGKMIGGLPWVNSANQLVAAGAANAVKQVAVYINNVNPHDFIVYDTGTISGYSPGYYVYKTIGLHSTWYTGSSKPQPAIFAGQTVSTQPNPISQGKCYTKVRIVDPAKKDGSMIEVWKFDIHKDDSLGFIPIGRVSEHPDLKAREYYLEGHKPNSQKTSGSTTGKKSVAKSSTHSGNPIKKKRHKKKGPHQGGSKKKNSLVRQRK